MLNGPSRHTTNIGACVDLYLRVVSTIAEITILRVSESHGIDVTASFADALNERVPRETQAMLEERVKNKKRNHLGEMWLSTSSLSTMLWHFEPSQNDGPNQQGDSHCPPWVALMTSKRWPRTAAFKMQFVQAVNIFTPRTRHCIHTFC